MAATPQRSKFKRSFGHANHFLVTIVVGLATVKAGATAPETEIPAAWSPKDAKRSAERSEAFAIQGAVVFLMTALDLYLAEVARLASHRSPSLQSALEAATRDRGGLRAKVRAFADFSDALGTAELALVEAAIQWRNRLVHPGSNARFNSSLREELARHAYELDSDYRHLDPHRMIISFESGGESPSLKEAAGMISATHRFIRAVDSAVLKTLDYEQLLEDVLRRHLGEVPPDQVHSRANRLWGRTEQRAYRALLSLAKQHGFSETTKASSSGVTYEALNQLATLTPRAAIARFRPDLVA